MERLPGWVMPTVVGAILATLGTVFAWMMELSEDFRVLQSQHVADIEHIREQGMGTVALMDIKLQNVETRLDIMARLVRGMLQPGSGE